MRGKKGKIAIAAVEANAIVGTAGNDWIEGSSANDILTGAEGRDTFAFRADSGHDVITDFTGGLDCDYILLDSQTGVWDGYLGTHWGQFADGMEFRNSQGALVATLHEVDHNGDGVADSQFAMASGATLTLLSINPIDLNGYMLFGG
jgi:Ca2+-binding RTX toxin-like protein